MHGLDESSAPSFTSCNLGINWAVFLSGDLFREERVSKFNQVLGRIYFLSFFKATRKNVSSYHGEHWFLFKGLLTD